MTLVRTNLATALIAPLAIAALLFGAFIAVLTSDPSETAPAADTLVYDGQISPESGEIPAETVGSLGDAGVPESERAAALEAMQRSFDEVTSDHASAGGVQQVLQYGYDSRNRRAWVKITGLDIAKGLITAAVAGCSRYIPRPICQWAGNQLKSLARNIKAVSNHGAWIEVNTNWSWRGGTW